MDVVQIQWIMKKNISFRPPNCLASLVIFLLIISCNYPKDQPENTHSNTQKEDLNLPAIFTGTIPCADCPGVDYQLIIEDHQFTEITRYQDRSPGRFEQTGTWEINEDTLSLKDQENSVLKKFLINEQNLTLLDKSDQQIIGDLAEMYILDRTGKSGIDSGASPRIG